MLPRTAARNSRSGATGVLPSLPPRLASTTSLPRLAPRLHHPNSLSSPSRLIPPASLNLFRRTIHSSTSVQLAVPTSGTTTTTPPLPLPRKILIANRGEIACRVIRTCKRLGIQTVAVFSEADREGMHVKLADEAYCIGPAPSAESYLRMDRIVAAAKLSGAEMIHPGYGFLSENSSFASLLASSGLKFIGPPESAIVSMGSKSASKEIMLAAGVPCVPGYHGKDQSESKLLEEAKRVGFPILIKAVKGGGGKGMKIVREEKEFLEQLASARREAEKSFGDGDVLIERYLERPRHVEVQVVSSAAPHSQHLAISTRDCSVQRRHQKIIEEAPAPGLSPSLLADLNHKATEAARAVGYEGAGTVEFIMDADTGEFFFMEMNTRLQVEHPVSEMISGIDLVEWQLNVAAGNALPMTQGQIPCLGHSFEARIYAEDTRGGFLPDVGHLEYVSFPPSTLDASSHPSALPVVEQGAMPNLRRIRVDTGFETHDEVSVHYDPMIAKLIVHGQDREDALRLMRNALEDTQVVGPKTNVEFLKRLCEHQAFVSAEGLETGFIGKFGAQLHPPIPSPPSSTLAQAALYHHLSEIRSSSQPLPSSIVDELMTSPNLSNLRVTSASVRAEEVRLLQRVAGSKEGEVEEREFLVRIHPSANQSGVFDVEVVVVGDAKKGDSAEVIKFNKVRASLREDGKGIRTIGLLRPASASAASDKQDTLDSLLPLESTTIVPRSPLASSRGRTVARLDIFAPNVDVGGKGEAKGTTQMEVSIAAPRWLEELRGAKDAAKGSVVSPMPSKVVDVRVKVGDKVEEGDVVVVLEAMKTEHVLRAPRSAVVARLAASPGSMVAEGVELVVFEEAEAKE